MREMPKVEVHLVSSHERPSGIGEPGVPPLVAVNWKRGIRSDGKKAAEFAVTPQTRAYRGSTAQ